MTVSTVSTVDEVIMMIHTTTSRKVLSQLKSAVDMARDNGRLLTETYSGLNKDIRDRADWLRSRK